ncbi:hypothetical protein [Sphingomonas kyeonggiensis]|uniref:Uncharacterized protein n=1 Tax=Sphingomonas kyeonggiensis TaxID=1268553 RepID=A0A7W6JVR5_9SPHN|nr:hypothetical protein [Sphingomonas kyeonggiensis]MBB4099376.1 hypothetical protein [Sphingomonas kyeonggiensis]
MTLILAWLSGDNLCVIADTRLSAGQRVSVDAAPKIYAVPVVLHSPSFADGPRRDPAMGFAFAGHTAAGHMTNALATAGLQALWSKDTPTPPTVGQEEIRAHYPTDLATFEGLVFGWEGDGPLAYTFEITWAEGPTAVANAELMDFAKFGLYAIGQGHRVAQEHIDSEWKAGRKATGYSALQAVITNDSHHSVGGSVQCAITTKHGVELKPVLQVDETGRAVGGFMGAGGSHLGPIGDLVPFGSGPVIIHPRPKHHAG